MKEERKREMKESEEVNVISETGNIIVDIERKYRKSKKRLIIESDDEEFMYLENIDNDYNEFIDLIRDIMNLKILIKEDKDSWIRDNEYRNELMKDSTIELLKKNIFKEED